MITARDLRAPLSRTVAGLGVLDIAAVVILSGYAVVLTSGVIPTGHPHGGLGASIGVLAMTLPLAWRRPAPLAAAAVMAAAALPPSAARRLSCGGSARRRPAWRSWPTGPG